MPMTDHQLRVRWTGREGDKVTDRFSPSRHARVFVVALAALALAFPASLATALKAHAGTASAVVSPTAVDFGSLAVGTESAPELVTVTNTGDVSYTVGISNYSGPGLTGDAQAVGAGCWTGPLNPGESCQFELRFKPYGLGARSAKIGLMIGAPDPPTITATAFATDPGPTNGWYLVDTHSNWPFNDISCPTTRFCMASARSWYDSGLMTTEDAGQTWTRRSASQFSSVNCVSTVNCRAASLDSGVVSWTVDGGVTWFGGSTGLPAVADLDCPDLSTCYATGVTFNNGPVVSVTRDGGEHWTVGSPTLRGAPSVSCPDRDHCLLTGYRQIFTTADHGHSWDSQPQPPFDNVHTVTCATVSECFAIDDYGKVWRTIDAAATWRVVQTHPTGTNSSMSCPTAAHCVVGFGTDVLTTEDGGETWSTASAGYNGGVQSMSCPTTAVCYGSGTWGTILRLGPTPVIPDAPGPSFTMNEQVQATEGQALSAIIGSGQGGVPPFGVAIDWGDGVRSSGSIDQKGNDFTVAGSHIYKEAGAYPSRVIVTDSQGKQAEVNRLLRVADAPIALTPYVPARAEGVMTSLWGRFTDQNPFAYDSQFTASIDWGDGTTSSSIRVSVNDGHGVFYGWHAYEEEGVYTAVLSLVDRGGTTVSSSVTVTVDDGALGMSPGPELTVAEGQAFSGKLADFGDENPHAASADFAATVDWGDGVISTGSVSGGGTFAVQGDHSYQEAGWYPIKILVTDAGGSSRSVTGRVHVTDPPISATGMKVVSTGTIGPGGGAHALVFTGAVAQLTDADTSALPSEYSVAIDWGDGLMSSGSASGSGGTYVVNGSHKYTLPGRYNLIVTVRDGGGSTSIAYSRVTI
jgi:hypothetical protein